VSAVESPAEPLAHVPPAVAVRVLQEPELGACATITPPFQNSKPVGLQVVGERGAGVSLAVAVLVFQDEELVAHGVCGSQCG
jgi:hypothetical protein